MLAGKRITQKLAKRVSNTVGPVSPLVSQISKKPGKTVRRKAINQTYLSLENTDD